MIRWLLNRDASADILSQPLVIVVPNSYDRAALQTWFSANGLTHNWTISSNAALLDTGSFDLYLADVDYSLANIQKAWTAQKPVLAFNNWYQPKDLNLAEFDLTWSWYGAQSIGTFANAAEQCAKASSGPQIQTILSNLQAGMPDFNYEATDCPNNTGTIACTLSQVTDSNGQNVETLFNQGATSVRNQLSAFDKLGINVFAQSDDKRLLKLLVLLGDKYRENIHYPMDKIATDDTTFYSALFADNAIHYARPNNFYQSDMGDFTDAQVALNTAPAISKTLSFTPTVFDEWTSTGMYAPPGKTITIRRTDSWTNEVKVRFNYLRESTKLWYTNEYSRPRYMASPSVTLKAGQSYTFSTPYGWPDLPWLGSRGNRCGAVYG